MEVAEHYVRGELERAAGVLRPLIGTQAGAVMGGSRERSQDVSPSGQVSQIRSPERNRLGDSPWKSLGISWHQV